MWLSFDTNEVRPVLRALQRPCASRKTGTPGTEVMRSTRDDQKPGNHGPHGRKEQMVLFSLEKNEMRQENC